MSQCYVIKQMVNLAYFYKQMMPLNEGDTDPSQARQPDVL